MDPHIRIISWMIASVLLFVFLPSVAFAADPDALTASTAISRSPAAQTLSGSTLFALCAAGFVPALFLIVRERQHRTRGSI